MKRARLIATVMAIVIALALVAVCYSFWRNEGPLWRLVMLKRASTLGVRDGHRFRGWSTVRRWSDQPINGPSVSWYTENGYKSEEVVIVEDAVAEITVWAFDGRVAEEGRP